MITNDLTPAARRNDQSQEGWPLRALQHPAETESPNRCKTLRTRLIQHESEFENLERPWSELARACGARPFQDFAWARAWVHTIGRADGRQLRIATLWDTERLLAILPLVRRPYCGARLLEWLGARAADYCDGLLHPSMDAEDAFSMLWNALLVRGDCDVIRLGQVRHDAKVHAVLATGHLTSWVETREQTHYIPIQWNSGEEWLQAQTAHARKQFKYDVRHLAKAGFQYYLWKSPDPYELLVEALIAQKSAWLLHKGAGPLMAHNTGAQFLREFIAEMAAQGTLHLSALRSKSGFAACHLGFYQHGVLYGFMPTYDPQWATYSPGSVLRDAFVMWACDHGMQRVDLLRGSDPYKSHYHPEHEWLQTYVIPCTLIGRACLSAYRLRQLPWRRWAAPPPAEAVG